jgi:hypothetical protein
MEKNKLFEEVLQESSEISSFNELSIQLLNLHGLLRSILSESYYKKYSASKDNLQSLKEAEKEISHRLGEFWQQSKLYRNQLQDYINHQIYKREKKKDRVLLLYTDTRKKSIISIRNLIRFLTYETEEVPFNNLRNAVRELIIDTNEYIENVWAIVQEILSNQIEINERRGVNTQEKYELFILNADDVKPDNPNPSYLNLDQLIQNLFN